MKFTNSLLPAAFAAALLLGGCKGKDGDPGPAGQNLTGTILGYVNPVDENGSPLAKSGVVISIDGANPTATATSGTDGKFELPGVKSGTYNLSFTRNGLTTFRRFGLAHVGGDQPTYLGSVTLSQASTVTVPAFSATTSPGSGTVTFNLTMASPTPTTVFRYAVLANSSNSVSPATSPILFTSSAASSTSVTSYTSSITLSRTTLTNAGFASGSTVYLAAVGSTAALVAYSDPATGRLVYPALNPTASPVISVVVP